MKIGYIIVILALSLAVMGCTQAPETQPGKKSIPNGEYVPKEVIESSNVSKCDEYAQIDDREGCYYEIGRRTLDTSICEKITHDMDYKDGCYLKIAIKKQDTALCEKIGYQLTWKELCYYEIGVSKGDLSLCDRVNHPWERARCYANTAATKKDVSICDNIEYWKSFTPPGYPFNPIDQNLCYELVASAKQDLSICNKISNEKTKQVCIQCAKFQTNSTEYLHCLIEFNK